MHKRQSNVRNIVSDRFWEFPKHKSTIGGYTCETIAEDSHVDDAGLRTEYVRELEESPIST